jgi:RecG-like helicase
MEELPTSIMIHAQCTAKKPVYYGRKRMRDITLVDDAGHTAHALFAYKMAYRIAHVKKDQRYTLIGRPQRRGRQLSFWYPEILETPATSTEQLDDRQSGRIYPIYAETNNIKPDRRARKQYHLLQSDEFLPEDFLPSEIVEQYDLLPLPDAIRAMHFPDSMEQQTSAMRRIMRDRLLRIQLHGLLYRHTYQQQDEPTDDELLVVKKSTATPMTLGSTTKLIE